MTRLLLVLLLFAAIPADAAQHRSRAVLHAFQQANPCPSTGRKTGGCPGYIKDHIKPLCAGGADAVENLQWQTKADGAEKDKGEWSECRVLKKLQ